MLSKQSITFDSGLMSSFLLFWNLTHNFFTLLCGPIGITMELTPYFLGLMYRAINEVLEKSFSTTTSGSLWFVQLWAYAYFPVLALEPSVPFESIPNVSSYGHYLMSLTEGSNDFKTCFK
ncbi:PMD domain-containing protein [Cephalotus follicularis]|uniref:PMD domain-containing protein n=1 Tax=Cephalotus follicularis TaxID=3775 RepID=A0A1Q3BEU3_CEPFO|nr:PMD domain-containing protein [Cephalotus follicularis]